MFLKLSPSKSQKNFFKSYKIIKLIWTLKNFPVLLVKFLKEKKSLWKIIFLNIINIHRGENKLVNLLLLQTYLDFTVT